MAAVVFTHEKNVPCADCQRCVGTGKLACNKCGGSGQIPCINCGGDGKGYGGLGECSNHSGPSSCSDCEGTGKQYCACIAVNQYVWEDTKDILGHQTPVYVKATVNQGGEISFWACETNSGPWVSFPNTEQAVARVDEIREIIAAKLLEDRKYLHEVLDLVLDDDLEKVRKFLSELRRSHK